MFGLADDAVLDLEQIDRTERQRGADSRTITKYLFAALVLFAPGLYWFLFYFAWAPISYFLVYAFVNPLLAFMASPAIALYGLFYWWTARGMAELIVVAEARWLRFCGTLFLLAVIALLSMMDWYRPVHSFNTPGLNIIRLLMDPFQPHAPEGVC